MSYLEIIDPSTVTGPVLATSDSVVSIDYNAVQTASELAQRAFESTTDPTIKDLANALHAVTGTLTEIIRGLDHGKITVFNYPSDGAHLK